MRDMPIDEIRQGESAELELKRAPDEQCRICDILKGNPKISIRKMAEMLEIRKNTLDQQISALTAKGFIERRNGTRGSWRVILPPHD